MVFPYMYQGAATRHSLLCVCLSLISDSTQPIYALLIFCQIQIFSQEYTRIITPSANLAAAKLCGCMQAPANI